MKAKEIIEVIEDFAPPQIQEEWDNSGMIVGDPEYEVTGVMLGLDCTEELVEEAAATGCNMIVTHHPLIFKGMKRLGVATAIERTARALVKNDMLLYSAHTSIDKVPSGVSDLMADKLGLIEREILAKEDDDFGLGIVGNLETPMDSLSLISFVKRKFSLTTMKCSLPVDSLISRVAVCGGSGSSLIGTAVASGAQVYISGDISYHNFFCEKDFMIIDIGHYESEIGVLDLLKQVLLKKIPNFAVRKSEKNNNPIFYY
jgi:dinuclear metal center YbgI/SA1388 family protein